MGLLGAVALSPKSRWHNLRRLRDQRGRRRDLALAEQGAPRPLLPRRRPRRRHSHAERVRRPPRAPGGGPPAAPSPAALPSSAAGPGSPSGPPTTWTPAASPPAAAPSPSARRMGACSSPARRGRGGTRWPRGSPRSGPCSSADAAAGPAPRRQPRSAESPGRSAPRRRRPLHVDGVVHHAHRIEGDVGGDGSAQQRPVRTSNRAKWSGTRPRGRSAFPSRAAIARGRRNPEARRRRRRRWRSRRAAIERHPSHRAGRQLRRPGHRHEPFQRRRFRTAPPPAPSSARSRTGARHSPR
jgi:hypothetical protein